MKMRISLEEFSAVIAAIHSAAASPERWPEALSAVARLVDHAKALAENRGHGSGNASEADQLLRERRSDQMFEPSVQRVMALLASHLDAAHEVQARLAEAAPGRLAAASLDKLAAAAFVVDGTGTIHHRNASARTLSSGNGRIRVIHSKLRFDDAALNRAFEAACQRATVPESRATILPLCLNSQEISELTVSPLPAEYAGAAIPPLHLALVVIARPKPDTQRIVERVRLLYGLTEAEARVMAALALGGTVDDIAPAHGVRISTIRAQVRSIFEKTGVNRQSDVVRLALNGVPFITDGIAGRRCDTAMAPQSSGCAVRSGVPAVRELLSQY